MPSIITQAETVADSDSGWSVPLGFAQFNPAVGTLTSIAVGLTADITGTAAIENLGATSATIVVDLPGTVSVATSGGTVLDTVQPDASKTLNLAAYDGVADFAGASGTIVSGFSSVATNTVTYTPGGTIPANFVGTGSIDLTASSHATSEIKALGNLLSVTSGKAAATVDLQYGYTPTGPASSGSESGSVTSIYINNPIYNLFNEQTTAVQTLRIADATTGWTTTVAANQFNPSLGTLESVNVTLFGDINTGLVVENLGSSAASAALNDQANISLTLPGVTGAFTVSPSTSATTTLSAFDGTIDFAGSSGANIAGLTGTQTTTTQDNNDLTPFTGTGTVALPVSAISPSTLTGPADLAAELLTMAGATVEISYSYLPGTTVAIVTGSAPTISGTQAGQRVTGQTTVDPFANVLVTDPGIAQVETVTVTPSAINGTLSNPGSGSYNAATGVYTVTGTAAAVSTALRNLIFTPAPVAPGQTVTTGFTISDTDTAHATASDTTTSVVATAGVLIDTTAAAAAIKSVPSITKATAADPSQPPPCFAAGTRIATPRGSIAVQHLQVNDAVITVSGREQAIQWIGRRAVNCRRHPAPERVLPVRVAAHAFGENRPSRPLLLSPDHSVFIDEVLIPVKFLINGSTVVQIDVKTITYYHLELPRHDIVLAEGLPTETYLETGSRSAFENGGGPTLLHADFTPEEARVGMVWHNFAYAPLLGTDGQLDRVRARLAVQAVMLGTGQHPVPVAAIA